MPKFGEINLPIDNPVLIVALVMLIILISPLIFRKLKVPGLVGIILSGTLVGPSVSGLLERDATIILLGTVGLLYLMFMAGLSIDLNQFNKLKNRSILFGVVSFGVPLGLSLLAGPQLLSYSIYTALLLGAIVGSHTLLAYPIANRLGITKNSAVTMTMGGTMVTDSLSLALLAIVAGSMNGGLSWGFLGTFGSSVGIFLAVSLIVIPRLGRWFFKTFPKENDADYIFLVAILFVTAWFAELAGLAPIIGAFLSGLLLNRLVPESSPLMSRVQFVGNALFIPFFLISVGMLVDVKVLIQGEVWIAAIIFTLLVYIGKYAAAFLSKLFFKHTLAEKWLIFGLSTPQAAATLAVTLIGFEIGLFNEVAVNAVVIMILITCLTGPWIVEKYGRIIASEEAQKKYLQSEAPQRILVPLANPTTAEALMDIAFAMRDKNSTESVYPLSVVRDSVNVESQVAESEKMLSHAVIYAAAADVPVNPVTRIDMNISNGITRALKEKRITNIIIGWNGESSARQKIFGGVLDQLLAQTKEMVMVCKIEEKISLNEHVVLAVPPFAALEPGFPEAMRYIKILVNQIGTDLKVIAVTDRMGFVKPLIQNTEPDVKTTFIDIPTWGGLFGKLDEVLSENTLFILNSAREGTLSWRPGLDRIPGIISNRFPKVNFISVFPSETIKSEDNSFEVHKYFNPDFIHLNLSKGNVEDLVKGIISSKFKQDENLIEVISRSILDNSLDYTPEIIPGVAILDAHTEFVEETTIFIGISQSGISVPKASTPIKVLVIVLNPESLGTEGHFNRLNAIAKIFKSHETIENLLSASSADEVVQNIG